MAFRFVWCRPSQPRLGFFAPGSISNQKNLRHALEAGATAVFQQDFDPALAQKLAALEIQSQLEINWWLGLISGLLLVFAIVVLIAVLFASRCKNIIALRPVISGRSIAAVFLIPLVISITFAIYPVGLARALTPFGVICLYFMVLTLLISILSIISTRTGWPITILLVGFAVLISLFGVNDNHEIRTVPPGEGTTLSGKMPETVANAFERWFQERRDKERYGVYPVYIVAAEGGGIYAAHRTATLLGDLQDLCPRFSQHLFAISSVSGGSVGAAIFYGLTQKIRLKSNRFEESQGCIKDKDVGGLYLNDVADEILQDDFLSPVLASFLFPDLLQKFLPFPVGPFDRARALERALELSWDRRTAAFQRHRKQDWINNANPLREPFLRHWQADGDSPALFFNTTEVASGRGRIISPFSLQASQFSSLPLESSAKELPLSTAAILSARFPWLTPAGWFRTSGTWSAQTATAPVEKTVTLVDGGYFDNSGVLTAQAIISEIESAVKAMNPQPKIKINLIVLTSKDFANSSSVVGDYLVPIETLLSTRAARGQIAVEQAEKLFEAEATADGASQTQSFNKTELHGFGYSLPLGWRLSELTRLLILGQNGDRTACAAGADGALQKSASCLKASIYQEMSK